MMYCIVLHHPPKTLNDTAILLIMYLHSPVPIPTILSYSNRLTNNLNSNNGRVCFAIASGIVLSEVRSRFTPIGIGTEEAVQPFFHTITTRDSKHMNRYTYTQHIPVCYQNTQSNVTVCPFGWPLQQTVQTGRRTRTRMSLARRETCAWFMIVYGATAIRAG